MFLTMLNALILEAFKKAASECYSCKIVHQARCLSDFILEDSGEPYGEKSLRNKFNCIQKGKNITELKFYVRESLSRYLDYSSFQHFVNAQSQLKTKANTRKKRSITKALGIFWCDELQPTPISNGLYLDPNI